MSLALAVLLLQAAAAPPPSSDQRPIDFHEQVGPWLVVGDRELGFCFATLRGAAPTILSIASNPASAELTFALKNDAWRSLKDKSEGRLWAHFVSGGEVTDSWNLAVSNSNDGEHGPAINFTIDRAKNDSASFIDQFAGADALLFTREKVPVARFDLKGSSKVIERMLACRAYLRADPNFDPFAR